MRLSVHVCVSHWDFVKKDCTAASLGEIPLPTTCTQLTRLGDSTHGQVPITDDRQLSPVDHTAPNFVYSMMVEWE